MNFQKWKMFCKGHIVLEKENGNPEYFSYSYSRGYLRRMLEGGGGG